MLKILWVTIRIFDSEEETQSGVWLKALANKLIAQKDIMLANISSCDSIDELTECDYNGIKQWAFPVDRKYKNGLPTEKTRIYFDKILENFNPDIIQIWGSENFLKLLPFDKKYPQIKILSMQGVLSSISETMLLGLSLREIISTFGVRELIKRRSIFKIRKSFVKDGEIEEEMIKKSDFIITQSEWTESQIKNINQDVKVFRTHRRLREEFLNCQNWQEFSHEKPIIYSAAVGYPYKGLHILIKSLAIVKNKFPDVELQLAGIFGRIDFLGDGYLRLILRMIKKLDLSNNVHWLGPLTAKEIVNRLQIASVFVNPSFIESYSMAFAEAMSVGTPSIVSFAGAMPELAETKKEALFYPALDFKYLSYLIIKILEDKSLSSFISKNSLKRSYDRNIKFDIIEEQKLIYYSIIEKYKRKTVE